MAVSIVKSLCVGTESTFSTVPGGTYSSFARVPGEEITWAPDQEYIARALSTSSLGHKIGGIAGGKGGTLTFKVGIPGLSTAAASTVTAVPHPWLSRCLKASGLAETLAVGSVVTGSGSAIDEIDVTSAVGFTVGQLVLISGEVRTVTAVNTVATPDNITITPALSGIPAAATVVYGCASYTYGDASPGTASFVCKGDGYTYTMTGCKGTVKLAEVSARGRPMLEFSFQIDAWTATEPTGTLPSLPTATNVLALSAPLYLDTTATVVSGFSFDPAMTVTPMLSTAGAQGRAGFVVTDGVPVATAKPYFDSALRTAFDAETTYRLQTAFSTGGASAVHTGTFGVSIPAAQISAYPGERDISGVVGHELAFACVSSSDGVFTLNFL